MREGAPLTEITKALAHEEAVILHYEDCLSRKEKQSNMFFDCALTTSYPSN